MAFDAVGFNINGQSNNADQAQDLYGRSNTNESGRKYRYTVDILLPSKLGNDIADNDAISFNVKSVTVPKAEYDEIVVHNAASEIFLPGKHHYSAVDISFYDVMKKTGDNYNGIILSKIWSSFPTVRSIQNQVYITNVQREFTDYRFDMAIHKLDGRGKRYQSYKLVQCYVSKFDAGDLAYTDNEIIEISMTIRYNKFYIEDVE